MSFLSRQFAKDGSRGTEFWNKISPPHQAQLLHQKALDKDLEALKTKSIKQSYGHPATDSSDDVFKVTCKEDFVPKTQRMRKLEDGFDQWNAPDLTQVARLTLGESLPSGAALVVRKGAEEDDDEPCQIMLISMPVITRPDEHDTDAFGAPVLGDIFDDYLSLQYVMDPSKSGHCMLGSVSGETFSAPIDGTREDFAEALLPVMMCDGSAISKKPLNGESWQIIFLPHMAECPVGFVWPYDVGFDKFKESVNGRGLFTGFNHLLNTREDTFRAWFDVVAQNPLAFAVPVVSALPMWGVFPSEDHPHGGAELQDVDLLAPFQEQQERFLRGQFSERILRGAPSDDPIVEIARCHYKVYLTRIAQCYPIALGIQLPPERQAFVTQLFPNLGNWGSPNEGDPDWSRLFTLDTTQIPRSYARYGSKSLPTKAKHGGTYKQARLVLPGGGESFADFLQVVEEAEDTEVEYIPTPPPPPRQAVTPTTRGNSNSTSVNVSPPIGNTHPWDRQDEEIPFDPTDDGDGVVNEGSGGAPREGRRVITPAIQRTKRSVDRESHAPIQQRFHPAWASPSPAKRPRGPTGYYNTPRQEPVERTAQRRSPVPPQQFQGLGDYLAQELYTNTGLPYPELRSSRRGYALVKTASILTEVARQKCPSELMLAGFLLASVIPDTNPIRTTIPPSIKEPGEFLCFGLPTASGRACMTGYDHGNNGQDATVRLANAIRYRARRTVGPFAGIGLPPEPVWISALTSDFVSRGYDIMKWNMDPQQPLFLEDKRFSILSFLPLLSSEYSSATIPADGLTWKQAKQLGMLVYYFFSMLGVNTPLREGNDYDDAYFHGSVFGDKLLLICRIVQNGALEALWATRALNCTNLYISDLSELLSIMKKFVEHRVGMQMDGCGIQEVTSYHDDTDVFMAVPSTMEGGGFEASTVFLTAKLDEYHNHVYAAWSKARFNKDELIYSTKCVSVFLRPTMESKSSAGRGIELEKIQQGKGRGKDSQEGKSIPFNNQTPPMAWTASRQSSDGGRLKPIQTLLRSVRVARGEFPKIVHPTGTSGKILFPLCLNSSFEGSCRCQDVSSCIAPARGRYKEKARLHLDLSDSKWSSSNYPEENWEPLVTFIKKHSADIQPTAALKALTPGTDW